MIKQAAKFGKVGGDPSETKSSLDKSTIASNALDTNVTSPASARLAIGKSEGQVDKKVLWRKQREKAW